MPNTAAGRRQAYLRSQSDADLAAAIPSLERGSEMRLMLEGELKRRQERR